MLGDFRPMPQYYGNDLDCLCTRRAPEALLCYAISVIYTK